MKILLFKIALALILFFGFITCKKYPENTLWFKNPYKIQLITGYISSYRVNGIDSLETLNLHYKPVIPNTSYPYSQTDRNIIKEGIWTRSLNKITSNIVTNLGKGLVKWNTNKKSVYITFTPDTMYYKKNIFVTKERLSWDILYLGKNGAKTKIKTTYNNNTYEITFEK